MSLSLVYYVRFRASSSFRILRTENCALPMDKKRTAAKLQQFSSLLFYFLLLAISSRIRSLTRVDAPIPFSLAKASRISFSSLSILTDKMTSFAIGFSPFYNLVLGTARFFSTCKKGCTLLFFLRGHQVPAYDKLFSISILTRLMTKFYLLFLSPIILSNPLAMRVLFFYLSEELLLLERKMPVIRYFIFSVAPPFGTTDSIPVHYLNGALSAKKHEGIFHVELRCPERIGEGTRWRRNQSSGRHPLRRAGERIITQIVQELGRGGETEALNH